MILSEGAERPVARQGPFTIEVAHAGGCFTNAQKRRKFCTKSCGILLMQIDLCIASANGTFVDRAESRALKAVVPDALCLHW
jgi:hypothetical protein